MTNKKAFFFFFWAAASLACMAAIFWFSSQNAEQSSELSGSVTHEIFEAVREWIGAPVPQSPDMPEADIIDIMETLEVLVRKSAHLAIFFVLGFCSANAVWQVAKSKRLVFLVSSGWCSFYAATDEFHQYFVPGRACMWQDWLVDVAGVLLGVGAAFFVFWLTGKRRAKPARARP